MSHTEIEKLQLERLQWSVKYTYDHVLYYRKKMEACKIRPEMIKTLTDLRYLPYTTKQDLQEQYPFDTFAQPKKNIVRIQGSSGTHGKPTLVGYTKNDLNHWSDLVARLITSVGVTDVDIAQIAFQYGLFTGAFGLHQGLEKVGVMVVPLSSGNIERQLMLLEDFQTTVLVATPSYAVYLAELVKERDLKNRLNLEIGLFGSEGCSAEAKAVIERDLGIIVTDNYGISELCGPGIAGECYLRQGLHVAEDHFIPEIIDGDTLEVLPNGETGELVLTSLTKEAMPLIRYRTGDLTSLNDEPCQCGRTHVRMEQIKGRIDDMLVWKGVNIFPSQIESAIKGVDGISPHYQLILAKEGGMQTVTAQIEVANNTILCETGAKEKLINTLEYKLKGALGVRMKVELLAGNSLRRTSGKSQRIINLC